MQALQILTIFLSLGLLIYLVFRGVSIFIATPLCAIAIALLNGSDFFYAYIETYMSGLVGFARTWLPVFMLGAIFAKVMEDSGASKSIALYVVKKLGAGKALISIAVAGALLTYGGVSMFVASFALYPLALAIFREANISRKLIPATIQAGTFTFTMTALPGSPAIQNIIPTRYFDTTASAAPIMGIISSIIMFGLSMFWLFHARKRYDRRGEFYDEPTVAEDSFLGADKNELPSPLLSVLPLILVLVVHNVVPLVFTLPEFVQTNIIIPALAVGVLSGIIFNWKRIKLSNVLNKGANNSIMATLNTSAIVGFGFVIRAMPAFDALTDAIFGFDIGNPLIMLAISIYIITGATGSSSGGMTIALDALGDRFTQLSQSTGVPLAAFHRVASISSGAFDSLPHNGGVIILRDLSGYGYKEIYLDMFVITVAIPLITSWAAIIMGALGII